MRMIALVIALVLALSGCGSTVTSSSGAGIPRSGELGLPPGSPPSMDSAPEGAAAPPGVEGGVPGGPVGSVGDADGVDRGATTGTTSSNQAPQTSTGVAADSSSAPGVTAKEISFGVAYTKSQGEANDALGAGSQDQGDVRRYYDALASDINKNGGVLGRKLKPVYFNFDDASGDTTQALYQQICEYFTKDHPVFVVFGLDDELMRACVQKAGILLVAGGGNSTTLTLQKFTNYFEISPRLERAARATVDGLSSTDFFQRARNAAVATKPVLGLLTWDHPSYKRALDDGYVPALREKGLSLKATAYATVPYSSADLSAMSASVSSAVLRFRQEGVTHVFIQDGPAGGCLGACLTLVWLKAAGSQGYYPRYGFNDSNSAKAGYDAGLWTATDVDDSRYVTWAQRDAWADSGVGPNKTRERCLSLLKSSGVLITNETARSYALEACDVTWFFRAALHRGPGGVNVSAMTNGVSGLGTSFSAASKYAVRYSASQHDGTAAFRTQGFNDGAWRWLTGVLPMA